MNYTEGDPALLRAAYDASGGLWVSYFKALWDAENKGAVAYSADGGTTFQPDEIIYDDMGAPSWPGMQLTQLPDGSMMTVFSWLQSIDSWNLP